MYNPLLNTLVAVADCGSFTKASETLVYITNRCHEANECSGKASGTETH